MPVSFPRMSANYCSKITVHLSLWRDLEPDARYRGALFQFRTRVRRRPGCTGTLLLPFFFSKLFERNALRTQFVRWGRSSSDRRSSALRTWPPQSRLVYMCVCVLRVVCCMYVLQRHSLPPELHPSCFTSNKRLFFMGRIQDGCPSSRGTKESQPPPK